MQEKRFPAGSLVWKSNLGLYHTCDCYSNQGIVRILACKPDKTKDKGQDKMRNDTQEFTWFAQFGYVHGQV
jgi:hypothetical protein